MGLGNELLCDDGAGIHVLKMMAANPPPGTVLVEVGTSILFHVHMLERAGAILALDAVRAGGPPGTVYWFDAGKGGGDGRPKTSMHEMGILNALRLFSPEKRPFLRVVGVEPADISYGMEPTAIVREALPRMAALARQQALDMLKSLSEREQAGIADGNAP